MQQFIRENKKLCILLGTVLAVLLIAVYLYTLLLPGIWYNDAFLYRRDDGSFSGSDSDASYELRIVDHDTGADISFSVNELTRQYRVLRDPAGKSVEIYEDSGLIFHGSVESAGDFEYLVDENGDWQNIDIVVQSTNPDPEALFPGKLTVNHWAGMKEYDIRGNLGMLLPMIILAILLALDIAFPDLFFLLEHGMYVDGGEPSDLFRVGQKIGRVVLGIGILVCIIMSFTTH